MALESVSGFYEGFTLLELEEAILWELGQVIGTTVSYDRFPKSKIRQKINNRQNWFVFHTHCLKKFALIVAKEGYRQYKLPINCMDGGLIAVKFYASAASYEELDVVDLAYMNDAEEGYLVAGGGTPEYAFMGDSYGNIPMMEVHPAPDEDGTSYSLDPDTGVSVGGDLPGATNNITGTATGGNGTELDDTGGVDFTDLGLVEGIYVRNVTDESYGYIDTIAETKLTMASTLTGGTDNTFSAGDSYNILAGEYGVLTEASWENDDQYIFGAEVGVLSSITVPAGNFRVDYVPYPLGFPSSGSNSTKPEIPKLYQMDGLAMGVVGDFLRTFHEKTMEFKRAEAYDKIAGNAMAQASKKKENRPFKRKPVRIRPHYAR